MQVEALKGEVEARKKQTERAVQAQATLQSENMSLLEQLGRGQNELARLAEQGAAMEGVLNRGFSFFGLSHTHC